MRMLCQVAAEILEDWKDITNEAARDALADMEKMGFVTDPYRFDSNGYVVLGQFLGNAVGWKGPVARRLKAELRAMCKR